MRKAMLALIGALVLATAQIGAAPPPEDVGSGRVAWFDISTTSLPQSKEFYGKLFDWQFTALKETDRAVEIVAGTRAIGTIRVAAGAISGFNGVVYIQVADILGSCKRATELGGTVVPGFPFNLPGGIGANALVVDPTGHPIGMYSRSVLPPPSTKRPEPAVSVKDAFLSDPGP